MQYERRKNARLPQGPAAMPTAVISMLQPFFQEPYEVEVQNVSSGGLKIYSPEAIPLNYEFDLEVNLPEQPVLRCKARAVYKIPTDDGFSVGIHFIDLEVPVAANSLSPVKEATNEAWDWLPEGKV